MFIYVYIIVGLIDALDVILWFHLRWIDCSFSDSASPGTHPFWNLGRFWLAKEKRRDLKEKQGEVVVSSQILYVFELN